MEVFSTSDVEELFEPEENDPELSVHGGLEETECMSWTGGVNHAVSESEEEIEGWVDVDEEGEVVGDGADLQELSAEEVFESLQREFQFHGRYGYFKQTNTL
ncbi:hypothetical protein BDQ17DRAFT_1419159 [Cyathus striatus]|nr:hypothetical protein BDQ17DRAFT_1419159 [Cyathus striatus]